MVVNMKKARHSGGLLASLGHNVDMPRLLCYKLVAFLVLLLVNMPLSAAQDTLIGLLPGNAVKLSEKVYKVPLDFDNTIKKIALKFGDLPSIRSDILIKENNFRVYVFYNLKETAAWQRLYIVEEEGKITARFF